MKSTKTQKKTLIFTRVLRSVNSVLKLRNFNPTQWHKHIDVDYLDDFYDFIQKKQGLFLSDGNKIYQITSSGIVDTGYSNINQNPSIKRLYSRGTHLFLFILLLSIVGSSFILTSCNNTIPMQSQTKSIMNASSSPSQTNFLSEKETATFTIMPSETATMAITPTPNYSGYEIKLNSPLGEYSCTIDNKSINEFSFLVADCPQIPKMYKGRQISVKLLTDGVAQNLTQTKGVSNIIEFLGYSPNQEASFVNLKAGILYFVPTLSGPTIIFADYDGNTIIVEGDAIKFVPTPTQTPTPTISNSEEYGGGGYPIITPGNGGDGNSTKNPTDPPPPPTPGGGVDGG